MAEDRDFEVIDKRRVSVEGTTEGGNEEVNEPGPLPQPETSEADAPGAEPGAGSTEHEASSSEAAGPPVGAREMILLYIGQLHEIAWSRMGLVPNPVSGTMAKDLNDARLAIDCLSDLVARVDPLLDPTLRRDMQTMLSNLRLNFVQQSQRE